MPGRRSSAEHGQQHPPRAAPYAGLTVAEFADQVASTSPAPGAGPSAAVVSCLAAALVRMVSAIELRDDPADPAPARARLERAALLQARALELADADAVAYAAVMDVVRRRGEPGHGPRLQQALSEAAGPPLEIAEDAAELTRLAADAVETIRGGARGEAVAAVVLAEAALRTCIPIVGMNLAGRPDDPRHGIVDELAARAAADLARGLRPPGAQATARAVSTRLTERFGLEHPVVLAPMAFAAGGRLAGAVSRAGGLGLIGGGYGDAAWIDAQFDAAGDAAVGCGLITWALERTPRTIEHVLRRHPRALMLSFGDPRPHAAAIHAAGVPLLCQVQSVADARRAIEAGAEVIVAQGAEAGGHGDRRATFTLVPEVADLIDREARGTLLCAAGGVADGRGLAAALVLGADGVVVGTRLWASGEADVADRMQAAALRADGDATLRTSVMDIARSLDWPERFTARVLRNPFTERWHGREEELRVSGREAADAWTEGWTAGDPERANTFVGEAAGLIGAIEPVAAIIERMSAEAADRLGRA